jgi:hypothetical protein
VFDYFRVAVLDGQTFAIRDDPFGSFGAPLSTALSRYVKDEFLRPIEGAEFLASPEAAAKDVKLRDAMRALVGWWMGGDLIHLLGPDVFILYSPPNATQAFAGRTKEPWR